MDQIIPLFSSTEHLESELKAAKESGKYAQDLEYFLTVEFLLSYKGSRDTITAYRRELEKLLLWIRIVLKKPIKTLGRAEIEDFSNSARNHPFPG